MSKRQRIQSDPVVPWDIKYFGLALSCSHPILDTITKLWYTKHDFRSQDTIIYCRLGQQHREDGPAVEWADGNKEWWRNGQLDRKDGPAIEYANGFNAWYRNGHLYRWERI